MSVNFLVMKITIERLEQVLREQEVGKADFMSHFNLSKQNWQHWRERGVPGNKIIPICEFLEISLDELTGKKPKKVSNPTLPSPYKEDRQAIHDLIDSLPPKLIEKARAALELFVVEDPAGVSQVRKERKKT